MLFIFIWQNQSKDGYQYIEYKGSLCCLLLSFFFSDVNKEQEEKKTVYGKYTLND